MQIFFSVGEPSGDEHAAALISELKRRRPDCHCVGFGGEEMESAGCQVLFPLTTMAVMGILQVLPLIRKFWALGQQAKQFFREQRPDAVVLVDFPGFNWWIAYYAKQQGIPVYYYMPPQLWAWGPWRVQRVRKYVDHVLSGLEFETKWYRDKGIQAEFVGHPFFESVADHPLDPQAISNLRADSPTVIGLLPGSRTMEVKLNWPVMLQTIARVHAQHPECRFLVACYRPQHQRYCEQQLAESGLDLPLEFHVRQTSEIIEAADFCLMVSGSVSLELLARKTPAVVLYKGSYVTWAFAKIMLTIDTFTLPNLISGRKLYPEFPLVNRDTHFAGLMADILNDWLANPETLAEKRTEIAKLADNIASSQASVKTVDYLLETLGEPEQSNQPNNQAA